jgi:hypothetical protein
VKKIAAKHALGGSFTRCACSSLDAQSGRPLTAAGTNGAGCQHTVLYVDGVYVYADGEVVYTAFSSSTSACRGPADTHMEVLRNKRLPRQLRARVCGAHMHGIVRLACAAGLR